MKRFYFVLVLLIICLQFTGCTAEKPGTQISATTLPVYEFTQHLCEGTDITVNKLITEDVSCLHDYSLQIEQMRMIEQSDYVIISGAGMEDFLADVLRSADQIIDASMGISLRCNHEETDHDHHSHENDPHIWLSPSNAKIMAHNIYNQLLMAYPNYAHIFASNMETLDNKFIQLSNYAEAQLKSLSRRELITFHDGFSYMADAFDLTILQAIEEESGAEASAIELIELIELIKNNNLTEIFIEKNGSCSAATIIADETDTTIYVLDMAVSGNSYFDAMYHNINTLKEALQ